MEVRYCLEMKNPKKFFAIDLYNRIKQYKANLIDLGDIIYITGVASFYNFTMVLDQCLAYGVVSCEVGVDQKNPPLKAGSFLLWENDKVLIWFVTTEGVENRPSAHRGNIFPGRP